MLQDTAPQTLDRHFRRALLHARRLHAPYRHCIDYIQDLDGPWLQPHCDVPEKLCPMVVYLCTGPQARDCGADIYNSGLRPITGGVA